MANRKAAIAATILCLCFVRAQCDAAASVGPSPSPEQEQEIQMLRSKVASLGESSRVLSFLQVIVILTLFVLVMDRSTVSSICLILIMVNFCMVFELQIHPEISKSYNGSLVW
jgi:hypothetical protein